MAYDADGNLFRWEDAVGNRVVRTFDFVGRPLTETSFDPHGQQLDVVRYHYDAPSPLVRMDAVHALGRVTWVEDAAGASHFGYDVRGRLVEELRVIEGREFRTRQAFDNLDQVVRLTYPDGDSLDYVFNARGLLARIPGVIERLEYNAAGLATLREDANGVVHTAEYDDRARIGGLKVRGRDGAALQDLSFGYGRTGLLDTVLDRVHPTGALSGAASYSYDALSRLRTATTPNGQFESQYDGVGNLTFRSEVGAYVYGDGAQPNALLQVNGASITHDANGNMTSAFGSAYRWNARGQLSGVEDAAGGSTRFSYDYEGQRVLKEDTRSGRSSVSYYIDRFSEERDGVLYKYVFSGDARVARIGGPQPTLLAVEKGVRGAQGVLGLGALLSFAIAGLVGLFGGGLRRQRSQAWIAAGMALCLSSCGCGPRIDARDDIVYFVADHLRSTTAVTDAKGRLVSQSGYDAWGAQSGATADPYAYTGHALDAETGLYYAGARYFR